MASVRMNALARVAITYQPFRSQPSGLAFVAYGADLGVGDLVGEQV